MWSVLGVLAVATAAAVYEIPRLWKDGMKLETGLFLTLLLLGVGLNIAVLLNRDLPNPLDLLIYMTEPISHWIYAS